MSNTDQRHQKAVVTANKPRDSLRLGFVGMGLMGVPMVQRLLQARYRVNIWNRSPEKTRTPELANAISKPSLGELVDDSDIIMICVSDSAAVEELIFTPDGIAQSARNDQIVIDFSSIQPDITRALAQQLHLKTGAAWIDAPVSGGVAGAESGSLAIMAGGPEVLIDALRPHLKALSQRVTRMGDVGCGQATKICNQMLVSCNIAAMAEVLAMAEKSGVDAAALPSALRGGFADSIPLQITGSRMVNKEFDEIKWRIRTLIKDLRMADDLSSASQAETPMSKLALSILQQHGDEGFLDLDPATLIERYTN